MGANYRFLTQKERDVETGLDYFLARYYSSIQGRFTSADEFTGGPDELFDFTGVAAANPTFYADVTHPQSLNKYQYCYNNPLTYVDPDGHQQALTHRLMLERGPNPAGSVARSVAAPVDAGTSIMTGVGKELANFANGMHNNGAAAMGGEPITPYRESNKWEAVGMDVTFDVLFFGGLFGKPQVGGVAAAKTRPTTAVTSEIGNATKATQAASTLKPGPYATESIPARGPQRSLGSAREIE